MMRLEKSLAPERIRYQSPIDRLLAEQGALQTPVGVFTSKHQVHAESDQARLYKQLIPLSKPGAGEQYAFQVDLDKCTGCKACVSACHSLNGLEDDETWRDAGAIHGGSPAAPYQQTVTTACHHCADPACLNGCPVLAYEKDADTGIVRHLDDQCIGCQYCVLKCPYDVPKYSKALGIVRKCDMCHGRLADGEAPACVQACPTEAIRITIVNTEQTIREAKQNGGFLPGAPSPDYTAPTTKYITKRQIPENALGGDHGSLRPEHAHFPLVIMLTLTQLSIGLYTVALFSGPGRLNAFANGFAFLFLLAGLASSTAHLGRPLGAWRAFLNLRRSWLSREIVVFGLTGWIAAIYTVTPLAGFISGPVIELMGWGTVLTGLIGIFCSVMIYHDTRREAWRFSISAGKFFGTTFGLGPACFMALSISLGEGPGPTGLVLLTGAIFSAKLAGETWRLRAAANDSPRGKSALLMLKPLLPWMAARFTASVLGMLLLPIAALASASPLTPAIAAAGFALLTAGEILERALYFKAVVAPKMPRSF